MVSKKRRNTMMYLAVIIVAFSICIGYYYREDYQSMETVQAHVEGDMITFSEESGFYDETVTVSLTKNVEVPASASIFYTLDGNDPTVEDMRYTGSIHLDKKKDLMVYPLKAVVYYEGEYSEIYEKTFVVCDDVSNELDIDIVSITSDSENLYDYETGILVQGKTFDEGMKQFDGIGIVGGNYSNRGEEWIRNAHVAIFDLAGNLAAEQNIGLGISGGTSAAYDVKSLKLYADNIYDKDFDKIKYNMTNEELQFASYSFVNEYNSIRLRAGSQDMEFGNIRSSVVSRLAQLSGSDNCTATKRCIVYLNGEYYGIFDMQQNYSNSYLAKRFGLENSDCIEKHKGSEEGVFTRTGISGYFDSDLNDLINRQVLERYVDMDNYLLYYAINVLCNNTDWPDNNFEMWRYIGENYENNQYSDGRYRFLIFDTDMVFNTTLSQEFFEGSKGDTFVALMEKMYRATGSNFNNVMDSVYYRDKFITYICDLLNTSFSTESVIKIIREENKKIADIRSIYYDGEFVKNTEFYVEQMIEAAKRRPSEIESSLVNYFGLNDKYMLSLETSAGITVSWNNMCIFENDKYDNYYYNGVALTLNQQAYPGYTFQYWIINGKKIYNESIMITDEMINEGKINVEAVAKINDAPQVIISELSARGYSDWLKISNVGNSTANLDKYYISDNEKNLMKYQLPSVVLMPGESIIIYGSKNHNSLGDYICNFSLNENENLLLSNEVENLFCLTVPRMSTDEIYKRYDNSNVWVFCMDN